MKRYFTFPKVPGLEIKLIITLERRVIIIIIIPILISAFGSYQRIIKGTGGLGNKRTSGDHPNYCIIENGQNTENSPGDLRKLAVTQTPMKDHQLKLIIIIIIIIIIIRRRRRRRRRSVDTSIGRFRDYIKKGKKNYSD